MKVIWLQTIHACIVKGIAGYADMMCHENPIYKDIDMYLLPEGVECTHVPSGKITFIPASNIRSVHLAESLVGKPKMKAVK